ncbi:MAG: TerB family tellurite resistance protein [Cyclobacteriaceae bacterium]|nr:TerB family tellurite resistance protein [Cyclobacteriaceae bacterium]
MNPKSKGWLKEYLNFREKLLLQITAEGHEAAHPDFSLYQILQPTGLMYGQPVTPLEFSEAATWSTKDRLKVLLAESLVSSSLLFQDTSAKSPGQLPLVLRQTLEQINQYYQEVFPELAASGRTFFGRKKDILELSEEIFERRIEKLDLKAAFWVRFFHSSLLFLDVFMFGQWSHTQTNKMVSDFFGYQREELRTAVVRVMAIAAHANRKVEFEERKLMEYFLQSAGLSAEQKKRCREIFEQGMAVEDLALPTGNSWLLKKYFLEIAILTFWSDKRVEDRELDLLHRLAVALDLHRDDVENSLLAVEGFVLEHWSELDTLQDKKSFEEVSEQFIQRMAAIASKNRTKLLSEVRARNELMALLKRARSTELDSEDKEELRNLLVEVLRHVPTLVMISLPHHFLTLPILMQILPKNFMADVLSEAA